MTDTQKWQLLALTVVLSALLYLLAPVLTPFAAAALFAYLGDPQVDRLETWRLSRTAAVAVVFGLMTLAVVGIVLTQSLKLAHHRQAIVGDGIANAVNDAVKDGQSLVVDCFQMGCIQVHVYGHTHRVYDFYLVDDHGPPEPDDGYCKGIRCGRGCRYA